MSRLTDTFRCTNLQGSLSYETCIKRQSVAKVQYYLDCTGCAQGAEIVTRFVPKGKKAESKQLNRWGRAGKGKTTAAKRQIRKRRELNNHMMQHEDKVA